MKVMLWLLAASFLLVSCSTVPYTMQRQIEEPPVIPPPVDRQVIEPPSQEQPGIPEHSDTLPEVTVSLRICRRDDECTKVKADCCGCTAGGTAAAINSEHIAKWMSTLRQKCVGIMCPTVMSDHWTCQVEPRCIENKCTLVKQ